jgi:tetratricopeptide (TPR) repeat protein
LLYLSDHAALHSAYAQAIAFGQRALALATASGEVVTHALANLYLGRAYEAQGNYPGAIDCFRQTASSFDGAPHHERFGQVTLPAVHTRAWLACCHAELGAFAAGRALGEEGLHIAEAVAHPASLMWAYWGIGLLALRQGDLTRALPRLEHALGICHETDLLAFAPRIAAALGEAYTLGERVADAISLLTLALEQGKVHFETLCSLPLGEAHLLTGRLEEAQLLAEHALTRARAHQERGYQAYALRLLGAIAAHRDPPDGAPAEAHSQQSLALAEALGMRPLQAHCQRGLGMLYAATGQREQARVALSAAMAL